MEEATIVTKINRLTDRIPDYLTDHWNEVIDELDPILKHESESEMNVWQLTERIRQAYLNILIMEKWVEEGKITSRTGFLNMTAYIKENLKKC